VPTDNAFPEDLSFDNVRFEAAMTVFSSSGSEAGQDGLMDAILRAAQK
jgi:hypothetical protein